MTTKKKKITIIIIIAIVLVVILAILIWLLTSSRGNGDFSIVLNRDGTLEIQANVELNPNDAIYIYWETDGGNLLSNTTNSRLLEVKARYDSLGIGLFSYGTYNDHITWHPMDNNSGDYFDTATILAHIEHTCSVSGETHIHSYTITVSYDNGRISRAEDRRMGNPVRRYGNPYWVHIIPWSWDGCEDDLRGNNTFVIRTGFNFSDDFYFLSYSWAKPLWESHPQVFGAPTHNGHDASADEMTTLLIDARMVTIYFPMNEHTGRVINGEFVFEIEDWNWDNPVDAIRYDCYDLDWLDFNIPDGETVFEEGIFATAVCRVFAQMYDFVEYLVFITADAVSARVDFFYGLYSQVLFELYVDISPPNIDPNDNLSGERVQIGDLDVPIELVSLYIMWGRDNVNDFSPLSRLTNLTSIEISGLIGGRGETFDFTDFVDSIDNLSITQLIIDDIVIKNNDISAISRLTSLTSLTLLFTQIEDLSALSTLTNLRTLNLRRNFIRDISFLENMTDLMVLNLASNPVECHDILRSLTNLLSLNLYLNNIDCIDFLSNLSNLEFLAMSRNNITDISPLANLTRMEELDISHNDIENISALARLVNLYILNLDGNPIRDFSPIANLPNLNR